MTYRRKYLTAAILMAAGIALGAQAAIPAPGAGLATKAAMFAATTDIAATKAAGLPMATEAQPPVASGTAAAGTAAAQEQPQTPAGEHDPEKLALGAQIFANLRMIDIAFAGVKIGMSQDPDVQKLPPAEQQRLIDLVHEEILARKDNILNEEAEANVDRFTVDQLKIILSLSQIKYLQDMVMAGAGLGPAPDPSTLTPAQQTLLNTYGNAAFVGDFLENTNMEPLKAELAVAIRSAVARFTGSPAAAPTT